jgi:hypothetical protein
MSASAHTQPRTPSQRIWLLVAALATTLVVIGITVAATLLAVDRGGAGSPQPDVTTVHPITAADDPCMEARPGQAC